MSKIDPERAAVIERIRIAAAALEIPQDAVDHVVKRGTSRHLSKHLTVLLAFTVEYGVSLDYLITGDLVPMLRCASLWLKATRSKTA